MALLHYVVELVNPELCGPIHKTLWLDKPVHMMPLGNISFYLETFFKMIVEFNWQSKVTVLIYIQTIRCLTIFLFLIIYTEHRSQPCDLWLTTRKRLKYTENKVIKWLHMCRFFFLVSEQNFSVSISFCVVITNDECLETKCASFLTEWG